MRALPFAGPPAGPSLRDGRWAGPRLCGVRVPAAGAAPAACSFAVGAAAPVFAAVRRAAAPGRPSPVSTSPKVTWHIR